MRARSRIGLAVAVLLFLALVVWWLYYVPYTPIRLYRVMPANVGALSAHRDLPERWEDLAANPIARSLFRSMGADPDEVAAITQDPMLAVLLEQLAGKDVVLGYVPSLGAGGREAWVASSWIGGKSNHLRWLAPMLEIEGLKRLPDQGGHPVWSVGKDAFDGGMQPSVALLEGILVCCWSPDPGAMRQVLDCYDGRRPSVATLYGESARVESLIASAVADRGWVLPGVAAPGVAAEGDPPVYFAFETLSEDRIKGRVAWEKDGGSMTPAAHPPVAADELALLLGDVPLAIASMQGNLARQALAEWSSAWSEALSGALAETDAPHLALALLGGDFSGRLKGIRVPALVVALQVADRDSGLRAVNAALDRLNAEYRFGAIAKRPNAGDLYRIDASRDHAYGRLAERERAGFAFAGEWLVLSSSFSALGQLVGRYEAGGPERADGTPPWRPVPVEDAAASGWLDLQAGGKTAKLALTAYSLKLLFSGTDDVDESLAAINEAKAWIDALSTLEAARLVLREEEGQAELAFHLGRQAP